MPELPDIQRFKDYLDGTSLKKKIIGVSVSETRVLQAPGKEFEKHLKGERLERTERLGKYLYVETSGQHHLVLHFGMTGKLEYFQGQDPPKYTQLLFKFENGFQLAYTSRRKFGRIYLVKSLEAFREEHHIGPDALRLSQSDFLETLAKRTGGIKGILTDQHVLSGIGNVYADEMFFQAGIHPASRANTLTGEEAKRLYKKMRYVLEYAVKLEGVRSKFPKSFLISHRKEGEHCPGHPGNISKISISGRSTYFCPSFQEEKK